MAVLREANGQLEFPLHGKVTVLGRDPSCDIVLSSSQVSSQHTLLINLGGIYYVEDLKSLNGTFVNGVRVVQRTRLASNDRLELPDAAFIFHQDEPPRDPPATQPLGTIVSSRELAQGLRVEEAPEAKLRAILEMFKTLGNTLNLEEVLPKILESLFAIFPQADRGFILLRDAATGQLAPKAVRHRREPDNGAAAVSRTVIDHALATGHAILSADAGQDDRFDRSKSILYLQLRSVMCVPLLSQKGDPLGVIQIDTQDKRNVFRQEDLDVLLCASTQAVRAVELARLHEEQRDLEAARGIQQNFLPGERPQVPGLHFFDYYAPMSSIGGDYYDYIPLPGDRLAIALGDVAGKGVSAALLMARLSAAVRFCLATTPSVATAVRQLNTVLTRACGEDRFVTFVVAVLDLVRFTMTVANAGHMPPLRRRAGGSVDVLGEEIVGLPLAGIDRPYEEVVVALEPGDLVLLYTDGVTEARNPAGEWYGVERLRAAVREAPATVEGLGAAVLENVRRFAAERPQSDDLTIVCFGREWSGM
ncbi:MAG TPA: SpoIIE family protein phosphatase [Gemmataceae bacterium]|nr:SpoIIE family protein phosphatase [Gemmataceae bacterium]